jgi:hypothetical protein
VRLATGDYFGESGLLTGEPLNGQASDGRERLLSGTCGQPAAVISR